MEKSFSNTKAIDLKNQKRKIENFVSISKFWTLEKIKSVGPKSSFCEEIFKREISGKEIKMKYKQGKNLYFLNYNL